MGEPTPVSSGPGAVGEGAARRGGSSGIRGGSGAAFFRKSLGLTPAVDACGGLEPRSIGML
jgi:hypothetical protein